MCAYPRIWVVSFKEAVTWSVVWIAISLLFNLGVYFWYGAEPALEFLTGYAVEKSLSVDMLFVFYLVFSTFGVPEIYEHKVLFWGILGALAMDWMIAGDQYLLVVSLGTGGRAVPL